MYCGTAMPEPSTPPPPAARRELPKGLDKAFQRAMLHGDMRQLRDVLSGSEAPPNVIEPEPRRGSALPVVPPAVPLDRVTVRPVTPSEPLEELPSQALDPLLEVEPELLAPPPPSIGDLLAELGSAVERARPWQDDPAAARELLLEARDTLDRLVERLAEEEGPPPLVLPPFRQPWALFVVPPGAGERLVDVAAALGIDGATARQVCVLGHPRAALRSADRADLEHRAQRYRGALGMPARVLDEGALRAQPAARLALTLAPHGPWCSAVSPSWEPDSSAIPTLPTRDDPPAALRLVVVGEVLIARYRELRGRRKDDGRLSTHGDRRLRVLDLHHDHGVLRVVEGITRVEGFEGLDERSTVLAFRSLPEALAAHFPDIPVTTRCLCRPTRQPEARDDGRLEAAGWPAWEEHSRACRLLYLEL